MANQQQKMSTILETNRVTISPENEKQLAAWLKTRGGIAVWQNCDLGSASLGAEQFTPATKQDGSPATSPDWRCGNNPAFIITDSSQITVQTDKEVARVKVRNGPPYLGCINRNDRAKLDKALEQAGEGSWYRRDYENVKYGSAWFEAVIMIPDTIRPFNAEAIA